MGPYICQKGKGCKAGSGSFATSKNTKNIPIAQGANAAGGGGLIWSIVTPPYSVIMVVLCGPAQASKMLTMQGWRNFRNACASLAAQR